MSVELTASEYMAAAYRIALTETTRVLLNIGRCVDGDRVVNYCSGGGDDNLTIASLVAPTGVVYAVDIDAEKLDRLSTVAHAEGHAASFRTWRQDAMFAADTPHVPTHILCLFSLDRLPNSRLATSRWAEAASPATKLLTADWGSTDIDRLPPVASDWALLTTVRLEFPIPAMVPSARRAPGAPPAERPMANVVVREWTARLRT